MKTIELKIYSFNELSDKAKQYAINKYYENETYDYLEEDMYYNLIDLINENECKHENIKLFYSLSYSQGDGVCFTGEITKNGKTLKLTHKHWYYFASSVNMDFIDNETGEDIDTVEELKNIYFDICNKLEKIGYSILEYRMNENEFTEHCEVNEYMFLENGQIYF